VVACDVEGAFLRDLVYLFRGRSVRPHTDDFAAACVAESGFDYLLDGVGYLLTEVKHLADMRGDASYVFRRRPLQTAARFRVHAPTPLAGGTGVDVVVVVSEYLCVAFTYVRTTSLTPCHL
jgi:hypothetical protein